MHKIFLLFWALLMISGCTGENCIDADDFGFANLTVSARYSKSELSEQFGGTQVAPWRDSNYRVNGRPLTILIRTWDYGLNVNKSREVSAWCPWFGNKGDENKLSAFCERLQDCQFLDGIMCTNTKDAQIVNAPCIFRNGIGLYALLGEKGTDPNISFQSQKSPEGVSFHLGEPTPGYQMLDLAKDGTLKTGGGRVYKYEEVGFNAADLKRRFADSKLYFKILDKFYDDNSGQYRISIKSGITDVDPDPITYISNLVKSFLFGNNGDDYGLIKRIYLGIVNNPGYRFAVSGILTLFIIYTSLLFLTGNIEITQTELIVRIVKIAIVSALLSSEHSWTFFHDYLFVFFIEGIDQVLQMIKEAGATGPGASGILALMIAPQTLSKLFSLLFVEWLGFIYILLFFFALYFVVTVFFQATVIYLSALITIGLIIIMGPIFICFLLFDFTKSLFENWLKQLISYALQPIILFTGLVFISVILRQEIYSSLGFRVCKQNFPKLSSSDGIWGDLTEDTLGFSLGDSMFYWWFPDPMKGDQFLRTTSSIPIPIDHFENNGDFCEAYGCVGQRYPDLPFLDPVKDTRRLNAFWNGNFVQLDGLLIIFVAIYLLNKFNGLTISMAKFISSNSGSLNDVQKAGNSATAGIRNTVGQAANYAKGRLAQTSVGRAITSVANKAKAIGKTIKQAPEKWIDKAAVNILKSQAVSESAQKSVLDVVKKDTGLSQSDIKVGSTKKYQEALAANLKEIDPSLTKKQALGIAKQMSYKNPRALPDEFAKAKFGKASFKELSKQEQEQVNDLVNRRSNGQSLKQLAYDAKEERRFKNAYVDAHQKLSEKGVGLVGKNIKFVRAIELKDELIEEERRKRQREKMMMVEQVRSGFEGVKSDLYDGVTGKKGDKDAFGKEHFGGAYHDIDRKDPALRTYDETLKEEQYKMSHEKIDQKIEAYNEKFGTNVTSPEFIADLKRKGDGRAEGFKELARQDVADIVHQELRSGTEPALLGETYMREYAKDSELKEVVENIKATTYEIFESDRFIGREDQYEYKFEQAKKVITDEYKLLSEVYGRDDIKPEEMPGLLEDYLYKAANKTDAAEINGRVNNLKESIAGFEKNQGILQQIDERKQMVVDEINKQVEYVNDIRQSVGMQRYYGKKQESTTPAKEEFTVRKLNTLQSFLDGLK